MSLISAVWPLKDLGDVLKKSDGSPSSLALAVVLPVCASTAAAILAADGLKAPTNTARIIVGGALGAAVAGTATTGLSGNRFPQLALLSLCCGALLGPLGAASLQSASAASSDAARQQRRVERAALRQKEDEAAAPRSGGDGAGATHAPDPERPPDQ